MIVAALPVRPARHDRRHHRGPGREPVPLHRLHEHHPGRAAGDPGAPLAPRQRLRGPAPMAVRRSHLTLVRPRTLRRRPAPARRRAARADRRLHRRLRRPAVRHADRQPVPRPVGPRRAARHPRRGRRAAHRRALDLHRSAALTPRARRGVPMLAAAAAEIGGAQIQNRGTIGGNIANGSPAGDTLPVLAAADAGVVLPVRVGGARRAVRRVLHRLSRHGHASRRADRRRRDPAASTAASGGARWARGGPRPSPR